MQKRFVYGFTLIELLVVIAIISLLVSVLLPSLKTARELAGRVLCASNLKSIGIGIVMYCEDNGGDIPYNNSYIDGKYYFWFSQIWPYLNVGEIAEAGMRPQGPYACPASDWITTTASGADYGKNIKINGQPGGGNNTSGWTLSSLTGTGELFAIADQPFRSIGPWPTLILGYDFDWLPKPRHMGQSNMLYWDNHVDLMDPGDPFYISEQCNNWHPYGWDQVP